MGLLEISVDGVVGIQHHYEGDEEVDEGDCQHVGYVVPKEEKINKQSMLCEHKSFGQIVIEHRDITSTDMESVLIIYFTLKCFSNNCTTFLHFQFQPRLRQSSRSSVLLCIGLVLICSNTDLILPWKATPSGRNKCPLKESQTAIYAPNF